MKNLKTYLFIIISVPFLVTNCFSQHQDKYAENIDAAARFFQKKEFVKAAESYSKAFFANNNLGRADHRYEAARCWALGGEVDSAFYQLKRCVKGNYENYLQIIRDSAFTDLKNDRRWLEVTDSIRSNKIRREESGNLLYKNLVRPLDTIFVDDQLYRLQLPEIEKKYGLNSPELKSQYQLIRTHDEINKKKIKSILNKYGWLSKQEVGEQGNSTLFLVIQHADLVTQTKYLPVIRKAVKQGKAKSSSLALLEDRVALRQGKKQIYGSQLTLNNKTGKYYVARMVDPGNVDKRRLAVGLNPIKDYVSQWGINWSIEQYEKDLAEDSSH